MKVCTGIFLAGLCFNASAGKGHEDPFDQRHSFRYSDITTGIKGLFPVPSGAVITVVKPNHEYYWLVDGYDVYRNDYSGEPQSWFWELTQVDYSHLKWTDSESALKGTLFEKSPEVALDVKPYLQSVQLNKSLFNLGLISGDQLDRIKMSNWLWMPYLRVSVSGNLKLINLYWEVETDLEADKDLAGRLWYELMHGIRSREELEKASGHILKVLELIDFRYYRGFPAVSLFPGFSGFINFDCLRDCGKYLPELIRSGFFSKEQWAQLAFRKLTWKFLGRDDLKSRVNLVRAAKGKKYLASFLNLALLAGCDGSSGGTDSGADQKQNPPDTTETVPDQQNKPMVPGTPKKPSQPELPDEKQKSDDEVREPEEDLDQNKHEPLSPYPDWSEPTNPESGVHEQVISDPDLRTPSVTIPPDYGSGHSPDISLPKTVLESEQPDSKKSGDPQGRLNPAADKESISFDTEYSVVSEDSGLEKPEPDTTVAGDSLRSDNGNTGDRQQIKDEEGLKERKDSPEPVLTIKEKLTKMYLDSYHRALQFGQARAAFVDVFKKVDELIKVEKTEVKGKQRNILIFSNEKQREMTWFMRALSSPGNILLDEPLEVRNENLPKLKRLRSATKESPYDVFRTESEDGYTLNFYLADNKEYPEGLARSKRRASLISSILHIDFHQIYVKVNGTFRMSSINYSADAETVLMPLVAQKKGDYGEWIPLMSPANNKNFSYYEKFKSDPENNYFLIDLTLSSNVRIGIDKNDSKVSRTVKDQEFSFGPKKAEVAQFDGRHWEYLHQLDNKDKQLFLKQSLVDQYQSLVSMSYSTTFKLR